MPKDKEVGSKAPEVNELTSKSHGLLDSSGLALAAPQAATGIFKEKVWNASGNLVEYIGVRVPLYITDELATYLYITWTGRLTATEITAIVAVDPKNAGVAQFPDDAAKAAEIEAVSQIKSANQLSKSPLTVDDMLYSMSRTKSGRMMMMKYRKSSDIFITSGGTNPIYVKSYYLKVNGIGDISSTTHTGGYHIDNDVTTLSTAITDNMAAAATLSLRTKR